MNLQLLTKPSTEIDDAPSIEELLLDIQPEPEYFQVDTVDKATWAARKFLEAEERITRRNELAKAYKSRIDKWRDGANKEDTNSVEYFKSLLRQYADRAVATQHKSRSVHLVGSVLSLRKKPDRVEVTESDLALSYCETEHPEALIVKKELSKSVLKGLLSNGTEIPGCRLEPGRDELYVKSE